MPEQPVGNDSPQSRSAEFSAGTTGLMAQGSTHLVQQMHPTQDTTAPYKPDSVLSPLGRSGIGQSASTFQQNSALSYYRS